MTTILIPMAGRGQRFVDAGFKTPKPFIDVDGKMMIERVIDNLTPQRHEHRFVFLCSKEHEDTMLAVNRGDVITIDSPTKGAACTALHARGIVDKDEPIVVASCDQIVTFDMDDYLDKALKTDGMPITYKSDKDHHSFCKTENGVVVEVAEKRVISNNANVGIYYFGSGEDFCRAAELLIDKDDNYNGEYYIAPIYNYLRNKNIRLYEIGENDCHILGTPVEMRKYLECRK